jgi:hypothetical protein
MLVDHNVLAIEISHCFKGYAEGPIGTAALFTIVLLIMIWRRRAPQHRRRVTTVTAITAPEMQRDPFIREKFTKERPAARKLAQEYFKQYPKDRYHTEVESWRHLQSANIEFTMKRLREPAGKTRHQ